MEQLTLLATAGQSKGLSKQLFEYQLALLAVAESDRCRTNSTAIRRGVNHSKIVGKEYLTHASPVGMNTDSISGTTVDTSVTIP